jgi:seryl-tRNA synthetase
MRYKDIIESIADEALKAAKKRTKANQQIDNARRKKSDASQKYQDSLRSANQSEQAAKAKLNSPR